MFLSMYKSMVRPHLEYASVVWTPIYKKDKATLKNTQTLINKISSLAKRAFLLWTIETLSVANFGIQAQTGKRADVIVVYKFLNTMT